MYCFRGWCRRDIWRATRSRYRAPRLIKLWITNLMQDTYPTLINLTVPFQCLPLAKTVDDYDALLPWRMPSELR